MIKPKLQIRRKDFCEWYYDKDMLRGVASDCYDTLAQGGDFIVTLADLYKGLGYLPLHIIKNPEAIKKEDIVDEVEIENPLNYEVEWLD